MVNGSLLRHGVKVKIVDRLGKNTVMRNICVPPMNYWLGKIMTVKDVWIEPCGTYFHVIENGYIWEASAVDYILDGHVFPNNESCDDFYVASDDEINLLLSDSR